VKPVLIDTHALLWWIAGDKQLSAKAHQAIATGDCYFSMAGCWETAIKEELAANGIALLPIEFRHVMRVAQLPFHHRDPFDRLLIAQAMEEDFALVSRDSHFDAYGVNRIW